MDPSEADRIIRPVQRNDIDPLSRSLGLTFHEYPIQRWMFPNEQIRTNRCPRSIAVYMLLRLPYETVFTTAELEGAAIWEAASHLFREPMARGEDAPASSRAGGSCLTRLCSSGRT
jgi:hypothetical protein